MNNQFLYNILMNKKLKLFGFTLTELLLIITLLGILGLIVTLGWNAATTSSQNNIRSTEVKQWSSTFDLYKSRFGVLPIQPSSGSTYIVVCLGDFDSTSNKCGQYNGGASSYLVDSSFLGRISKVGNKPTNTSPPVNNQIIGPIAFVTHNTVRYIGVFQGSCPSRDFTGALNIVPSEASTDYTNFVNSLGNVGTAKICALGSASKPTVTFSATSTSTTYNGSSTLNWSSINASLCTASGAWSGLRNTAGSELKSNLTSTNTYTITCQGPGGYSDNKSVTVNVSSPVGGGGGGGGGLLPTVTLTATPSSIPYGGSTTLSWTSTGTTPWCTPNASPSFSQWSGSVDTSGSIQLSNLTQTTDFTLSCNGVSSTPVTVTVGQNAAPSVSLTASTNSVYSGGNTTLTWSSSGATSCQTWQSVGSGWGGQSTTNTLSFSGSQQVTNITQNTEYQLTCYGFSGIKTMKSVTVYVSNPPPAPVPTVTLSANPTTVDYGGSTTLAWSSTNASYCGATNDQNNSQWTGSITPLSAGNKSISNMTATTVFSLTCTGPGGTTASNPLQVVVNPPKPKLTTYGTPGTYTHKITPGMKKYEIVAVGGGGGGSAGTSFGVAGCSGGPNGLIGISGNIGGFTQISVNVGNGGAGGVPGNEWGNWGYPSYVGLNGSGKWDAMTIYGTPGDPALLAICTRGTTVQANPSSWTSPRGVTYMVYDSGVPAPATATSPPTASSTTISSPDRGSGGAGGCGGIFMFKCNGENGGDGIVWIYEE